ncbi:MAG: NAD(P)H-dependent oxidoreductase [Treponema sp.]|jgi:flavodoxin|nr:NAD(P)H-dependent oxidoreductase [Treponema sp.]
MKTLIAYYSYEGNCRFIAGQLKAALDADVLEIEILDSKKRKGFAKYFWGGKQVLSHAEPELKPFSVDVNAYDLIILGCPVWAASPAPALCSFISRTAIHGKRVALFVCHGGGKGDVFGKLRKRLAGNTFSGEKDFRSPLRGDQNETAAAVREWAKTLI